MSEIKGQLLGIILTIVVFGATSIVLAQTFKNTSDQVATQSANETDSITEALYGDGQLLSYGN